MIPSEGKKHPNLGKGDGGSEIEEGFLKNFEKVDGEKIKP